MVVRHRRKFSRMRGTKSHGWGMKKKHRGGGSQGGKGMSGMLKHKKSWMLKNDPDHFGRVGFRVPNAVKNEISAITLKDLDALASRLNANEIDVSKYGYQKVLSTGRLTKPLIVKAKRFVEKAKEKILEAGGQAIEL